MGGLAGHMSHVHEDLKLKLIDIFEIMNGVVSGEIKSTEKVDGQNIMFKVDPDGTAKFSRNKGDISRGGRTYQKMINDFNERGSPVVAMIYGDGGEAIQKGIDNLPDSVITEVFLDPEMPEFYINSEIIHEKKPNIIVYDANYIVLHNAMTFADSSKTLEEMNQKFDLLVDNLNGTTVQLNNGTTWKIVGPQSLPSPREYVEDKSGFDEEIENIKSSLLKSFMDEGLTDQNTIGDFAQTVLQDKVLPQMGVQDPEAAELLCNFLLNGGNGKEIRQSLSEKVSIETLNLITMSKNKSQQRKLVGSAIGPINTGLHRFATLILNNMNSVIAKNPDLAAGVMRNAVMQHEQIKQALQATIVDPRKLEDNLLKLDRQIALLGDLDKLNSSIEGIVFKTRFGTYKFTGPFAAANQVLGLGGFEVKDKLMKHGLQTMRGSKPVVTESYLRLLIRESLKRLIF
jgi:hypothetical protein